MALITSPWLHASQSASGPCSAVTFASQRRTAATARADIAAIASPFGKTAALGCCCTTGHSGSLASFFSGWPSQSPYPHSIRPSSAIGLASGRASSRVCRQRISGLVTTAASGQHAQPLADPLGLAAAGVVELDRLPAGQPAGGVGGGPAVPQQQNGGH